MNGKCALITGNRQEGKKCPWGACITQGGIPVCASSVIANCPVVFTLPGFAGDSATEKRAQQHLERAALMLRTTEKSIAETAAECGFRNPKYFMTLFKKVYGVTPGQWRNMKEMPSPPPDKA